MWNDTGQSTWNNFGCFKENKVSYPQYLFLFSGMLFAGMPNRNYNGPNAPISIYEFDVLYFVNRKS